MENELVFETKSDNCVEDLYPFVCFTEMLESSSVQNVMDVPMVLELWGGGGGGGGDGSS